MAVIFSKLAKEAQNREMKEKMEFSNKHLPKLIKWQLENGLQVVPVRQADSFKIMLIEMPDSIRDNFSNYLDAIKKEEAQEEGEPPAPLEVKE